MSDRDYGEGRSGVGGGGILAGMTDADLARTLAQAGFMEPLAKQVANFLQLAEQSQMSVAYYTDYEPAGES